MAQSNMMVSAGLMLALLLSAGCGVTDDPSEGGILGGINGLASGKYEERLANRQVTLGRIRTESYGLQQDNRQLGDEAGGVTSQRSRLHRQIVALDAKTTELTERTSRLRADTEAKRQQRVELDRRLQQVRSDLAVLNRQVDENRMTVEETERQRRELEQELADLSVVADALR